MVATSRRAADLERALRSVIRGQDDVLRLALVSIFAKGHLLIEGAPGVGKTTLGQTLARAILCRPIAFATSSPARNPSTVMPKPTSGGSSRLPGERSAALPATDSKIRHG